MMMMMMMMMMIIGIRNTSVNQTCIKYSRSKYTYDTSGVNKLADRKDVIWRPPNAFRCERSSTQCGHFRRYNRRCFSRIAVGGFAHLLDWLLS